jgi:hypothetical protein
LSKFVVAESDLQLEKRSLSDQLGEGFRPRPDLSPWALEFPVEWGADPYRDNNWRFHLSAMRMVDPYILEFQKTGEIKHLHEALRFFYDWHDYHFTREIKHRYSWYDMSTGQRAAKLAYLLERVNSGLLPVSDTERAKLNELADAHIAQLMLVENIASNNHGIFQMLGLKLLGDVTGNEAASGFAEKHFRMLMSGQFTSQGVHTENSPDYHFYMQNTLRRSKVERHLGDPFEGKGELVASLNPWLTFPNGEIARIGDSADKGVPLTIDPERPVRCRNAKYAVKDLSESGYVIIRSLPSHRQDSMLFVTGMAHTVDHKHADELSFELYEGGEFLFVDSGKFGYKSGQLRSYFLSAAAHNTVSLVETNVSPTDVRLTGSLLKPIEYKPNAFIVKGEVDRPGLFRQNRKISYSPGRELIITDEVAADEEREFVSSLHLAPNLTLNACGDDYVDEAVFFVRVGTKIATAYMMTDGAEVEIVRGQEGPLLGWNSPSYLKAVPSTVVRAKKKGKQVSIKWRVELEDWVAPSHSVVD